MGLSHAAAGMGGRAGPGPGQELVEQALKQATWLWNPRTGPISFGGAVGRQHPVAVYTWVASVRG